MLNVRYIIESVMPDLATAVRDYLHDVLGIVVPELPRWTRADELSYYLRDAFEFREIELLGQPIVLAIASVETRQSLSEVRTRLAKVSAMAGRPTIYVTGALASYERRRLIELKVPFIVPGNQLYLPDLGIDLREYFRKRAPAAESPLSPSAQALLITALLQQPWQAEWEPWTVAAALGYSSMTLSRAIRELTAAGLAAAHMVGRSRRLSMPLPPAQTWERALPLLRTPIKRTVWVDDSRPTGHRPARLAGLSALARHSMLTEPQWQVVAVSNSAWKGATDAGVRELPEYLPGASQWQLWTYTPDVTPDLGPDIGTVDPLSLTLSLRDSTDDRVQLALGELKAQFPW